MNVREKASRRADEAFRDRNFNAADAVRDAALRLKRACSALKRFGKLERLNEAFKRHIVKEKEKNKMSRHSGTSNNYREEAQHLYDKAQDLRGQAQHLYGKGDCLQSRQEQYMQDRGCFLEGQAEHLEDKAGNLEGHAEHLEDLANNIDNQEG